MLKAPLKPKRIRKTTIKPAAVKVTRPTRKALRKQSQEDPKSISVEQEEYTPMRKVPDKMQMLVDQQVPQRGLYRVYSEGDKVYNASLMLADIAQNNNKFYIVQLLQSIMEDDMFAVYTRWGRVGFDGQSNCYPFSNAKEAIEFYEAKFREKAEKGYTEIKIALEEQSDSDDFLDLLKGRQKSSKLNEKVQVTL